MSYGHDKLVLDWRDSLCAKTSSTSTNMTGTAGEDENRGSKDVDKEKSDDDDVPSDSKVVPKTGKESALRTNRTISFVCDNLDTSIKPRGMRVDHQVKSLHVHLFHFCGAVRRVETLHLDDQHPPDDLPNLLISAFLPSKADCVAI